MGDVIAFPFRSRDGEADLDIDLVTAVDVAIRDLRDIAAQLRGDDQIRQQADECLAMLKRALAASQTG
ncbi:hypothetical protein [Ancylobacter terrae]|uniref:hypothetical protein n=1 Tax=Ancylobacter sp. sgz301288 TaxID=3342077 RepID=UPI00385C02EA